MTSTLTLTDLADSARGMGYVADVIDAGGNVRALSLTIRGDSVLVALGDGTDEGDTWSVSTDGELRERIGEWQSDELPVTSDADQTIGDAHAWLLHVAHGYSFEEDAHHGYGCGCPDAVHLITPAELAYRLSPDELPRRS